MLYDAQRAHCLATTGAYARVPTLVTLVMYPILVVMYALLGKREEREMLAQFGEEYRRYQDRVPGFFPKLGSDGTIPQP